VRELFIHNLLDGAARGKENELLAMKRRPGYRGSTESGIFIRTNHDPGTAEKVWRLVEEEGRSQVGLPTEWVPLEKSL
jgi:hypothetical protein